MFDMFGGDFFEIFFAQCTLEGRNSEKIPKKSKKIFKIAKNVQKRSQKCPDLF